MNLQPAYSRFTADYVEYMACCEHIIIYPTYSQAEPLGFIQTRVPAFQAGVPVKVPLWLALQLREKNKCIIARPTWMNLDSLKAVFAAEKRDGRTLTPLPYYFSEIAHLLCRRVPEDMGADVDAIMATLADIEETRAEKLKAGTDFVLTRSKDPGAMRDLYIPVPNIVEAEYASLRIGFCKALDVIATLASAQEEVDSRAGEAAAMGYQPSTGTGAGTGAEGGEQDTATSGTALAMRERLQERLKGRLQKRKQAAISSGDGEEGADSGQGAGSGDGIGSGTDPAAADTTEGSG